MVKLTEKEREAIRHHVQVHVGVPFFEPFLKPYWKFVEEEVVPRNLGAATISLIGLVINIVTCALIWYYSSDAKHEVPAWAIWVSALGVHLYQTSDGVDGFRERRTGMNDVLGEYFDHVCDALTTAFLSTRLCIAVGIGSHPLLGLGLGLCASVAFYMTHWNAYTTGMLEFETLDNSEGQNMIILACVLAAIFGTSVFDQEDPVFGIEFKVYVVSLAVGGVLYHCLKKFAALRTHNTTVEGSSPKADLLPLVLALALSLTIFVNSTSGVFVNHFSLYICMFGTVLAKLINNLLIAKIAKKRLSLFDTTYLGPMTLILNQIVGCPIDELLLLVLAFVFCLADHCHLAYDFGYDICRIHDDAPFFTQPKGFKWPGEKKN